MISSRSGWSNGSPPLMVMIPVPSPARISIRRSISAVGTGSDPLSYSLRSAREGLQRRMGMI